MAHITGGGFKENIVRILPENINAEINLDSWQQPEVFNWIQTEGNVDQEEMLRTFNCGIGFVLVVSNSDSKRVINALAETGHNAYLIGEVTTGKKEVRLSL